RGCRFLSLPGLAMPPTRGWQTPPPGCRQPQASPTGLRVFSADARLDLTPFALARACTFCIQLPAGAAKVGVRLERSGRRVTLAVGGFGNSGMPLQLGAPDMAFPKINRMSYWVYFLGGVVMLVSFFLPGGAAQSGWTSYPPLSVIQATLGQTAWLVGMIFLIT